VHGPGFKPQYCQKKGKKEGSKGKEKEGKGRERKVREEK
jgi:hypothetical protein